MADRPVVWPSRVAVYSLRLARGSWLFTAMVKKFEKGGPAGISSPDPTAYPRRIPET